MSQQAPIFETRNNTITNNNNISVNGDAIILIVDISITSASNLRMNSFLENINISKNNITGNINITSFSNIFHGNNVLILNSSLSNVTFSGNNVTGRILA